MAMPKPTMEMYIGKSPEVFAANLERSHELTDRIVSLYIERGLCPIRFVASGSSFNACSMIRPFVEEALGVRVQVLTPSRYLDEFDRLARIEPDAFEVFVSQSGCSTNIIDAVRLARAHCHRAVALTGNMNSDLRDEVDELIDYGVGNETVGFVTLGVITLMEFAALFALDAACALGAMGPERRMTYDEQLARVPALHREIQRMAHAVMDVNDDTFLAPSHVFMCGSGSAYGVALEGALKWQETLKAPAIPLEPEEYIHGPNMQLTPASIAVFIDPSPKPGRVYDIYRATREVTHRAFLISAYGCRATDDEGHCIGLDMGLDEVLAPFALLPAVQLFAGRSMEVLDCEPCHPLFKRFEKRVRCKTDDYEDQVKRKLAEAGFSADGKA